MKEIQKILVTGPGTEALGKLLAKAGLKTVSGPAEADLLLDLATGGIAPRQELFKKWDAAAAPDALLATGANFGVTEMAGATRKPERVVGLNFVFNPFEEKAVVQIAKGLATSADAVEACRAFAKKLGVLAVVVDDAPGFIVDRVMAAVINEAILMFSTGVASKEDIDRVAKLCLNWPAGPFELADTIGLDNILSTLEVMQKESPRFQPSRLLRETVAAGRLGKKTGQGFYAYKK